MKIYKHIQENDFLLLKKEHYQRLHSSKDQEESCTTNEKDYEYVGITSFACQIVQLMAAR